MSTAFQRLKRALLPLAVFAVVWALHYLWLGYISEQSAIQNRWAAVNGLARTTMWRQYLEGQSCYIGFSYAISLAFGAYAFLKYREDQCCPTRNVAIGSVTLSGFLAVLGCFLIGCCGSPMPAVYLGLFGASFFPFAKPLIAALTIAFIFGMWVWMNRTRRKKICREI